VGDAAAAAAVSAGGGTPPGQQELSKDVLVRLLGVKADLALLAIMCSGNDYLPAVREAIRLDSLWARWAVQGGTAAWVVLLEGFFAGVYCCCTW